MSSVQYVPQGERGFRCTLVSTVNNEPRHVELLVSDVTTDSSADIQGDDDLRSNPALMAKLLSFGVNEYAYRNNEDVEQRSSLKKAAARDLKGAEELAEFMHRGSYQTRRGWCSWCFTEAEHNAVDGKFFPPAYLCQGCGEATTPCAGPGCRHLARRVTQAVQIPRYCVEHRHELRSFEKADETYVDLDAVDDLRTFDKKDLAGITRMVVVSGLGIAVIAPLTLIAAPAIGGALGASGIIGPALSGAAATSHGLAFLGGGSLAAGGLGMAGGTAVVVATGGALGGVMGAVTTAAYVQDDKSFRIEKLREGTGTPVVLASGFLTEGADNWNDWQPMIDHRYPENPVYRVHWGAKELKAIGVGALGAAGVAVLGNAVRNGAQHAMKAAAKKLPGLNAAFIARDLAANPWHVAKNRADQTAAVLADVLARVETPEFILVGHSLGARVMLGTAELLGTKSGSPRVKTVHLLGTAVGEGQDWKRLNDAVSDRVWNYHSRNDQVLKVVYKAVQGGQTAVGYAGFNTSFPKIVDVDLSNEVDGHSAYFGVTPLRGSEEESAPSTETEVDLQIVSAGDDA